MRLTIAWKRACSKFMISDLFSDIRRPVINLKDFLILSFSLDISLGYIHVQRTIVPCSSLKQSSKFRSRAAYIRIDCRGSLLTEIQLRRGNHRSLHEHATVMTSCAAVNLSNPTESSRNRDFVRL